MNKEQEEVCLKYKNNPGEFINSEWNGFDVFKETNGKMNPFPYQKKFVEFIHANDYTISAKTRQMHLSSTVCAYIAWYALFNEEKTILMLCQNSDSAKRMLNLVRGIIFDFIKKYNLENEYLFKIKNNNTRELSLENRCKIISKPPTADAGKGEQIHFLLIDEAAFIKNLKDIWLGVGMALSATNGKCIMISSTNGFDFFYKTWINSLNGNNSFVVKKFKWDIHPKYSEGKYIDEKTNKLSSPWRDGLIKNLRLDDYQIDSEIDCEFSEQPKKIKKKILSIRVDNELYNKINKCLSKRKNTLNISDYFRALVEEDYEKL